MIVAGQEIEVTIVRHHQARRYVIRLGPERDVRLTVPRGASIAGGLAFAARQAAWLEREWRRAEERAAPWTAGTHVWFRGEPCPLVVAGSTVTLSGSAVAKCTGREPLRAAVERGLRALAALELTARTREFAAHHGLTVAAVGVRNQRSRWGTCSPQARISLNWRLIQMPPAVSDYVILHELMHLRHPNHSRRFWREVDRVCAGWRDAERWLRKHGRELH
jgi:predicted metal-dependent hydrolase